MKRMIAILVLLCCISSTWAATKDDFATGPNVVDRDGFLYNTQKNAYYDVANDVVFNYIDSNKQYLADVQGSFSSGTATSHVLTNVNGRLYNVATLNSEPQSYTYFSAGGGAILRSPNMDSGPLAARPAGMSAGTFVFSRATSIEERFPISTPGSAPGPTPAAPGPQPPAPQPVVTPTSPGTSYNPTVIASVPGFTYNAELRRFNSNGQTYIEATIGDKKVYMTAPDAQGIRRYIYEEDGKVYAVQTEDRTNKIVSATEYVNGQPRQMTIAPDLTINAFVRPTNFLATGPQTAAQREVPGTVNSALSENQRELVASTTDKSQLITFIDPTGKVQVISRSDRIVVNPDGTVQAVSASAPPQNLGTRLPSYVQASLLSNPDSTFKYNQNPANPSYTLTATHTDTEGIVTDYQTISETTYSLPPADATGIPIGTTNDNKFMKVTRTTYQQRDPWDAGFETESTTNSIRVGFTQTVGAGNEAHQVEIITRTGTGYYDSQGRMTSSVTVEQIPKAELVQQETERISKMQPGKDKEEAQRMLDQLKNAPADYVRPTEQTDVRDSSNRQILYVDKDGNYFRPDPTNPSRGIRVDVTSEDQVIDAITAQLRAEGMTEADAKVRARELKSDADHEQLRNRRASWVGYYDLSSGWELFKDFLSHYGEFQGFESISSLFMGDFIEKNRQTLVKNFCGFAGIDNCFVSAICGEIHKISADNVLVGRDERGQLTNSASLNGERSESTELAGLSLQELRDILGNTSTVGGRYVDLTDDSFNPATLGSLKLRLYHVEYSITNTAAGDSKLRYNLEFRRTSARAIIATEQVNNTQSATLDEFSGDYSRYVRPNRNINNLESVASARWFSQDKTLDDGKSDHDHKYKYSTNEFDVVCLVFTPGLPSGSQLSSTTVKELCVPFSEYTGAATQISIPQSARNNTTTTAPASGQPARPSNSAPAQDGSRI